MKKISTCIAVLASCAISACASIPVVEDEPASGPMEPVPLPVWEAGKVHRMKDLKTGKQAGYEIAEVLENGNVRGVSLRETDAGRCSWINSQGWFAPSVSWENCGSGEWGTGTQKVTFLSEGSIWPLRAGARAEYRRLPTSSQGKRGTPETRKCEVIGPVSVNITDLGPTDAMKVQCNTLRQDGTREARIWYWNAEYGEVKYIRMNSRDGLKRETEIMVAE